jgi:hypothetical protein
MSNSIWIAHIKKCFRRRLKWREFKKTKKNCVLTESSKAQFIKNGNKKQRDFLCIWNSSTWVIVNTRAQLKSDNGKYFFEIIKKK